MEKIFKKKPNIGFVILAVLVTVVLWFYVKLVEDPERTITVSGIYPTFIGEDAFLSNDFIIVEGEDKPITISFRGKLSDLAEIKRNTVTVECDISRIGYLGERQLAYEVKIPDRVANSVYVMDKPDYIVLKIDKIETKDVPVVNVGKVSAEEGFNLELPIFEPSVVTIQGPLETLKTVDRAEVEYSKDKLNASNVLTLSYKLKTKDGSEVTGTNITRNVEKVDLKLVVKTVKNITFDLSVVPGGGLTKDNLRITAEPASIEVSGDADVVQTLNSLLVDTIQLASLETGFTKEYPVVLPNGVKEIDNVDTVVITVELIGVASKDFYVTNINALNAGIDDDFEVKLPSTVKITVRGTTDTVSKIDPNQLRADIDLTGQVLQVGAYVSLNAVIQGLPPEVGLMNVPSVNLTIVKK